MKTTPKITAEDIRALHIADSNTGLMAGNEPSLVRQSRKLKGLGLIGPGGFITEAGKRMLMGVENGGAARVKKDLIYRKCPCGETAHEGAARKNEAGAWEHFYRCRNCRAIKPVPKKRAKRAKREEARDVA